MNPHYRHPTSPAAMGASLWRNREFLVQMTRREVVGRYRGSVVGLAWSFFNPLLLLVVYTVVFSGIFKARWGAGAGESATDFATILFVGMIVHGFFAECINRAPNLILGNPNLVKKVVFPLEMIPWATACSALFHLLASLAVLLLAQLVLQRHLPATVLFFPLVLAPLVMLAMGCTWFLAATGVFIRDIAQATGMLTTVLLFLSPVFYPLSAVPEELRTLIQLNPLTFLIDATRAVLVFGEAPAWTALATYFAGSLLCAWAGFWWFQKTRKGFADVL